MEVETIGFPNFLTISCAILFSGTRIPTVFFFLNTLGKLLDVFTIEKTNNTINISDYSNGFYFFKIIGEKEQQIIKVIKE